MNYRRQIELMGFDVDRGNYATGNDDRQDRWYLRAHSDRGPIDKRGRGFGTLRDVYDHLVEQGYKPCRRKAGRPASLTGAKPRNLYLDDETFEALLDIGDGNASDGVRIAVSAYRES